MDTQNTDVREPGPAPGSSPPPRRNPLRRSTTDRVIGGVSGGIGRRFGVDPVVLRVAFVVGILLAGFGPLLYLALWLLLPDDRDRTQEVLTREPLQLIVGLILAMVAAGSAVHWVVTLGQFTGLVVAGFLIGLGIWLYTRRDHVPAPVTELPTPPVGYAYGGTGTSAPAAEDAYGGTATGSATGYGEVPYGLGEPAAVASPQPTRDRSYLGLATLCVVLLAAGVLGIAQALGWLGLSAVTFMAVLLGILAIGLLIGAFAGRSRWLVAPALLLALVMAVTAPLANFLPGALGNGVGDRTWVPTEPGGSYAVSVGRATLDLTPWAGRANQPQPTVTDSVTASVTAGELDVTVPTNWDVVIDARVGAGDIVVAGERADRPALDARYTQTIPATGEPVGRIRLVLDVQYGTLRIRQAEPVAQGSTPESTTRTQPRSVPDDSRGSAR